MSKKTKILIVEDDNLLSGLYKNVFSEAGYRVQLKTNGQEAIDAIKKTNFDIIILDFLIPIYNAIEILEQTREQTIENPNNHIIILSNMDKQKISKQLEKLGVTNLLTKTNYTPKSLLQKIKQITQK